jgi:TolA-binding protein
MATIKGKNSLQFSVSAHDRFFNRNLWRKFPQMLCLLSPLLLTSCNAVRELAEKHSTEHDYHTSALHLAKENRNLNAKIGQLEFEIQALQSKSNFLQLSLKNTREALKDMEKKRDIASMQGSGKSNGKNKSSLIGRDQLRVKGKGQAGGGDMAGANAGNMGEMSDAKNMSNGASDDLVEFSTYNWKPNQMIVMAEKSFQQGDFDRSTKFYYTFFHMFPKHELIDDKNLFLAGIAAYKSGKYYAWGIEFLTQILSQFPNSKYYRGAKLWIALSQHKLGNNHVFYSTMEEFRLKYRNTSEWNILSAYYENFRNKFKN